MKIVTLYIFFIFLSDYSFAQIDDKSKAIRYFVKVTENTKIAYLSMSNSADLLNQYTSLASQNSEFKLDSLRIDTLSKSMSSLITVLQKNISSLDSLEEVDYTFAIKDSVKSIYNDAIPSFRKIFSKFQTIFENGISPTSKDEINQHWIEYLNSMKSISAKIDTLGNNSSNFLKKYNIDESELKINGL